MEVKRLVGKFATNNVKIINTNRRYKLSSVFKEKSEDFWKDYLEKAKKSNIKIWEGVVYRIQKVEEMEKKYKIFLGTLGHKDTICTSFLVADLEKLPFEDRPNGMYISCFLESSDGKFIFGNKLTNGSSKYKIIGGVLNEDETRIEDVEDFYEHFYKEFEEETSVNRKHVVKLEGAGIFIMPTSRVNVCLYGQLDMKFNEFLLKARPNYEHENFVGLTAEEVKVTDSLDNGVMKVFEYL